MFCFINSHKYYDKNFAAIPVKKLLYDFDLTEINVILIMLTDTFTCRNLFPALILMMVLCLSSCAVYTVDKSHLETKLKPSSVAVSHNGLGLNKLIALYKKPHNNRVDTLVCLNKIGQAKPRRVRYDSKMTVITNKHQTINFYAKSLYIWNEEFLVGERTTLNLRKANCFSVKLKDIARIEVRG